MHRYTDTITCLLCVFYSHYIGFPHKEDSAEEEEQEVIILFKKIHGIGSDMRQRRKTPGLVNNTSLCLLVDDNSDVSVSRPKSCIKIYPTFKSAGFDIITSRAP